MPLTKAEINQIAKQMAAILIEKGTTPSKSTMSARQAASSCSGKSATSKATTTIPKSPSKPEDDDTPISRGKADALMSATRLKNAAIARKIPHSNNNRLQLANEINLVDGYTVTDLQAMARKSGEKVSGTRDELLVRMKLIKG